jgi:type VI secretion system protein ImpK
MPDSHDPFKPHDATVMRPRPGAGRRGANEPAPPKGSRSPLPDAAAPPVAEPVAPGLNPLVQAASPLLRLAGQLRGTLAAPDAGGLRGYVLDEIRRFEDRARASNVTSDTVMAARYVLCAAIDEAVLSTPWGAQSDWAQQTLLVALHGEAWGGERFFDMLDRISDKPDRHIDLMELQYICLALGFEGRYQVQERGHTRLAEVRQALYRKIRGYRGPGVSELSLRWQGLQDRRHRLIRYVPWWVVAAAALALVALAFVVYYTRLAGVAGPVKEAIGTIGTEALRAPVAASEGPRLRPLLKADEDRGALSVREEGGRTIVTLPNLFASGRSEVNAAAQDTLRSLALALDRVPGRVWVVGHTDDQPYRDNFALSRERALRVAEELGPAMREPARLEVLGRGDAEPLYLPPSLPANRALNRRVEIIHVSGS